MGRRYSENVVSMAHTESYATEKQHFQNRWISAVNPGFRLDGALGLGGLQHGTCDQFCRTSGGRFQGELHGRTLHKAGRWGF